MLVALTRAVADAMDRCELTHLSRVPIDVGKARLEHEAYEATLAELGCHVERVEPAPALPDSVFIEDTAIVLDELAIITRPGAASRRDETEGVARSLSRYRSLEFIDSPATLDGGDVLRIERDLFVGISERTDPLAVAHLRELLRSRGYRVTGVAVTGCLHLKSAVTSLGRTTVLINPSWIDRSAFTDYRHVEVDADEPFAANALAIGEAVLHPMAFPKTRARIERAGFNVVAIESRELAKAEGGLTCCSLIFQASASEERD